MTRTCSLELSCTTFAITEACACRIEPGGSVAKPTVCALAALPTTMAAAAAQRILLSMEPPPRVARVYQPFQMGRCPWPAYPSTISEMKLPKDRIPYSAIVDRPALRLPNDGRIAVWTIV